jgi:hypothetical protein
MKRILLDKIASATRPAKIDRREILIGPDIVAEEGRILAVRVLNAKVTYNEIENDHGRMQLVKPGDIVAGVLGHRRALRGYSGVVPDKLEVGDRLHILSPGGVLGRCTSINPDFGPPFEAEVLGAVLSFPYLGKRIGVPATIRDGAIPLAEKLTVTAPLVQIIGTCMEAGKTRAACEIIHGLCRQGLRVGAAKCTGVSRRRDIFAMLDHGAFKGCIFTDAGIVTTSADNSTAVTRTLVGHLCEAEPNVVLLELGDGILGEYGVGSVLADGELQKHVVATVLCANDPVAAWGGVQILEASYGIRPDCISGPATDNAVGCTYIEKELGIRALNARTDGAELAELVAGKVENRAH